MARRKSQTSLREKPPRAGVLERARRWLFRGVLVVIGLVLAFTAIFSVVNPPATPYMLSESHRLDGISQVWVPMTEIAPVMARSAVAAEDANYCLHWGLDLLNEGAQRGGSTISQQVVKNVYLWQDRSWARKSLEAVLTPLVEVFWSKERILEVYLNVAEFDEGVFGVEAAARHYFGVAARDLDPVQAARLAMVLPSPKTRDAARPTETQRRRSAAILDGAETIRADGRAACFSR